MRILIAEDQPKVRFALRVSLEQRPGFKTIGEAIDAEDLLVQIKAISPDLVLLDWDLPGMPIVDLLTTIRQVCPDLHVIALSEKPETREAALAAGASAFVSKGDPPEQLLLAIDDCWTRCEARIRKDPEREKDVSECQR